SAAACAVRRAAVAAFPAGEIDAAVCLAASCLHVCSRACPRVRLHACLPDAAGDWRACLLPFFRDARARPGGQARQRQLPAHFPARLRHRQPQEFRRSRTAKAPAPPVHLLRPPRFRQRPLRLPFPLAAPKLPRKALSLPPRAPPLSRQAPPPPAAALARNDSPAP